jgi:hypothetical protein
LLMLPDWQTGSLPKSASKLCERNLHSN